MFVLIESPLSYSGEYTCSKDVGAGRTIVGHWKKRNMRLISILCLWTRDTENIYLQILFFFWGGGGRVGVGDCYWRKCSSTVISVCWATVEWSWPTGLKGRKSAKAERFVKTSPKILAIEEKKTTTTLSPPPSVLQTQRSQHGEGRDLWQLASISTHLSFCQHQRNVLAAWTQRSQHEEGRGPCGQSNTLMPAGLTSPDCAASPSEETASVLITIQTSH